MKKIYSLLLTACLSLNLTAINNDSLLQVLETAEDTSRIYPLLQLSESLVLAGDTGAGTYALEVLQILRENSFTSRIPIACNLLGNYYNGNGQYSKALQYLFEGLEISEKLNQFAGASSLSNNIANAYLGTGEYEKAKKFFLKAYDHAIKSKDHDVIAVASVGLGSIYQNTGEPAKGIPYIEKAAAIFLEQGNKVNYGVTLHNLAEAFEATGKLSRANTLYDKALKIMSEAGYQYGEALMLAGRAKRSETAGDYQGAITDLKRGIDLLKSANSLDHLADLTLTLSEIYARSGNKTEAYANLLEHLNIKDSLSKIESEKIREELTTRYETAEKEKTITLLNKEKEMQAMALGKQKMVNYLMLGAGILLLVVAGTAITGYRSKKRANMVLSGQKAIIEDKNREITDSIRYARLIQEAIFPPVSKWESTLPEHFILFKPKDIVSGDFYWLEKAGDITLLSVADCTGHGVPGAMMSMVGCHGLNYAVHNLGLTDPGPILDSVNTHLRQTLTQDNSSTSLKDGMDIGLLAMEKSSGKTNVKFSGANNPLWVIRKNDPGNILEIPANRQPIGSAEISRSFEQHQVVLEPGDTCYLFSDGYADQFGGERGKKLKYKELRNLLISLAGFSLPEQKQKLESFIDTWKGSLEQVDDICIVGVRV